MKRFFFIYTKAGFFAQQQTIYQKYQGTIKMLILLLCLVHDFWGNLCYRKSIICLKPVIFPGGGGVGRKEKIAMKSIYYIVDRYLHYRQ